MNIGIIGAGNVGSALGRASVGAGHAVVISAVDPKHAAEVATKVGARGAANNRDAVMEADVVILAVPYDAVADIAAELGDVLARKADRVETVGAHCVVDRTSRSDWGEAPRAPSSFARSILS